MICAGRASRNGSSQPFRAHQANRPALQEWIAEIATDVPSVILVKLADNLDNADPRRLRLVPREDQGRLRNKYAASIPVLRKAALSYGWAPPGVDAISGLWPDRSPASSSREGRSDERAHPVIARSLAARRPPKPWLLIDACQERPPLPPSKARIAPAVRVPRSPASSNKGELA